MKRKITLATAVAVITTLIYFYSAGSLVSSRAETVEGASHGPLPREVVYSFETCGNCHAVPDIAGRDLGVEERGQCDACHGDNNRVIVAASSTRPETPAPPPPPLRGRRKRRCGSGRANPRASGRWSTSRPASSFRAPT